MITAASGGNRESLLGPRPARRKCFSKHEADAGCRNPTLSSDSETERLFLQLTERPQQPQSRVAALFRVELSAVHPARLYHTGDGEGIVADGQRVGGAVLAVVAVDVVEILAVPDVLENRVVVRMWTAFQPI